MSGADAFVPRQEFWASLVKRITTVAKTQTQPLIIWSMRGVPTLLCFKSSNLSVENGQEQSFSGTGWRRVSLTTT